MRMTLAMNASAHCSTTTSQYRSNEACSKKAPDGVTSNHCRTSAPISSLTVRPMLEHPKSNWHMVDSSPVGHILGIANEYGISRIATQKNLTAITMREKNSSDIPQAIFHRSTQATSSIKVGPHRNATRASHLWRVHPTETLLKTATPTREEIVHTVGIVKVVKSFVKLGPPGNWYLLSVMKYTAAPEMFMYMAELTKNTKLILAIMGHKTNVNAVMMTRLTTSAKMKFSLASLPAARGTKIMMRTPMHKRRVSPITSFCPEKNLRISAIFSADIFLSPKPRNITQRGSAIAPQAAMVYTRGAPQWLTTMPQTKCAPTPPINPKHTKTAIRSVAPFFFPFWSVWALANCWLTFSDSMPCVKTSAMQVIMLTRNIHNTT
mmetsp:Transcript_27186/g.56228  ORF Transcript_27186/g.56228 Transcript_27186/m.56228 type:complete len:378 (-) Transcript_27186:594-1727(-)